MSQSKIADLIDKKADDKNIAQEVASYLIDTNQTLKLDSLLRDVMTTRELRGTYELTVSSAHELDTKQIESIKSYIKKNFDGAKEVIIHNRIDPGLLGGVRIESANYLIDRTIKSKLAQIKSSIES